MKTILVSIDAKYIHENLAVRSLKANTVFDVDLMEFTIKDSVDDIAHRLLEINADVYGFSVYLWNVGLVEGVLKTMRAQSKSVLVLGGPEVTYDYEPWIANKIADYVVLGEGEWAFDSLLHAIEEKRTPSDIPNLAFCDRLDSPTIQPITDLGSLKSPHRSDSSTPFQPHKIHYVEASRGCPYRCSYCLASLDKPVRFFSIDRVKDDLLFLIKQGAKTIKFLDRTFNANKQAIDLFAYLIEHRSDGLSIQFEMTGDLLPDTIVDFVNEHAPKGLFRFEIGVQSTDEATNRLVDRIQDTERLFSVINRLRNGAVVDLHLDLIAGLPGETLNRFRQTFDETYALGAKELQLGILKLLKGTKMRKESSQYGYVFEPMAPYAMASSNALTPSDLQIIKNVETMLDRLHNKGYFRRTLEAARARKLSMFEWFQALHAWFDSKALLPSRVDLPTLFSQTDLWLERQNDEILRELLKLDYLECYPRKPKLWWKDAYFEHRGDWIERAKRRFPNLREDTLLHHAVFLTVLNNTLLVWYEFERCQVHII